MICRTCKGTGAVPLVVDPLLPKRGLITVWENAPCPTCGGCGVDHCCGGDCAQPEPEEKSDG